MFHRTRLRSAPSMAFVVAALNCLTASMTLHQSSGFAPPPPPPPSPSSSSIAATNWEAAAGSASTTMTVRVRKEVSSSSRMRVHAEAEIVRRDDTKGRAASKSPSGRTTTTALAAGHEGGRNATTTTSSSVLPPGSNRRDRWPGAGEWGGINGEFFIGGGGTNALSQVRARNKNDEKWFANYDYLVAFRNAHGHCLVPQTYPPNLRLGRWVQRQRSAYSQRRRRGGDDADDRGPSYISTERIKLLNDLGFVWDAKEAVWEARYAELCAYRKRHGHCNVPQHCDEEYKQLSSWVQNQRVYYSQQQQQQKREKEGAASVAADDNDNDNGTAVKRRRRPGDNLTPERKQRLEQIGFIWDLNESNWMKKFDLLKLFRNEFGHVNVPSHYEVDGVSLGQWVLHLRVAYKAEESPHHTIRLSPERIESLNSIGFVWDRNDARWWEKFGELKKFQRRHGHVSVPQHYQADPKLGRWVMKQRRKCRECAMAYAALSGMAVGKGVDRVETGAIKVAGLNEERIKALEEIGLLSWHSSESEEIQPASTTDADRKKPRVPRKTPSGQGTQSLTMREKTVAAPEKATNKKVIPFPWDEI